VKNEPVPHQYFHASLICWFFGEREDAPLRVNPSGDISCTHAACMLVIRNQQKHVDSDFPSLNPTVDLG